MHVLYRYTPHCGVLWARCRGYILVCAEHTAMRGIPLATGRRSKLHYKVYATTLGVHTSLHNKLHDAIAMENARQLRVGHLLQLRMSGDGCATSTRPSRGHKTPQGGDSVGGPRRSHRHIARYSSPWWGVGSCKLPEVKLHNPTSPATTDAPNNLPNCRVAGFGLLGNTGRYKSATLRCVVEFQHNFG